VSLAQLVGQLLRSPVIPLIHLRVKFRTTRLLDQKNINIYSLKNLCGFFPPNYIFFSIRLTDITFLNISKLKYKLILFLNRNTRPVRRKKKINFIIRNLLYFFIGKDKTSNIKCYYANWNVELVVGQCLQYKITSQDE
jgi:hypothetical protein